MLWRKSDEWCSSSLFPEKVWTSTIQIGNDTCFWQQHRQIRLRGCQGLDWFPTARFARVLLVKNIEEIVFMLSRKRRMTGKRRQDRKVRLSNGGHRITYILQLQLVLLTHIGWGYEMNFCFLQDSCYRRWVVWDPRKMCLIHLLKSSFVDYLPFPRDMCKDEAMEKWS